MTNSAQRTPPSPSYLNLLKQKLSRMAGAWTIDDYHALVTFYSSILPSIMEVERCTIFVMELGSQTICSIVGTGLEQHKIEAPLEGSIVGTVIDSGRSYLTNDLKGHEGYHSFVDEQTGFDGHNMICAPIKSITGNSVTGAVQILNKLENNLFTREDQERLEEIAHFLSLSIESIVLNQEILRLA